MTNDELREHLADRIEREIRPLLYRNYNPFDVNPSGYDCCGCETYDLILDHAVSIVLGEQ